MNYLRFFVDYYSKLSLLLLIFFLSAVFNASAADVRVTWDENSESDLAGYKFYYGTSSGNYTFSEDVGNTTSYTATNLIAGETYYFAAKAYNTSDIESGYSTELVYTLPTPVNQPPSIETDPDDASVNKGAPATFKVVAAGTEPLSYQWQRQNGAIWDDIGGATGSFYTISAAIYPDDDGARFRCRVSNTVGPDVVSAEAALTVSEVLYEYFENFENYSAGSDPASWLDTGANNSMVEDDGLFVTYDVGGETSFGTSSTLSNIHSHYSRATYDAVVGFVFTGHMRMSASDSGMGVTFLSDYPNSDTYYRLRRYSSNAFHLAPHGASVSGDIDSGVTPTADTWYEFKVQVQVNGDRTEIKANVWEDGTGEPAGWQIDAWDDSAGRLTSGKIGVWSYSSGSKYWDDLKVELLAGSNSAPNTPAIPIGPSNGYVQTIYSYDTSGTDPDGDLLTYRFNWGDGSISAWGGAHARTHTYAVIGDYCLKAQSQDTHGATSGWSACLNVDIDIQKHTIIASAGLNGSISPSGSVTVANGTDQSFSINPNQDYRVADVVVDGSSVGSLTTYTFDNVDRGHTIAASYVLDNQAPVSKAGADQSVRVFDTVQLDGSGSSDVNGDSLNYIWSFISKPDGSNTSLSNTKAQKPSFVADVVGTYTVRLIVNDGTVNSAPDTVIIVGQNTAPVSQAGPNQTVQVNDTVQLDGSNSSDADGDSLTYTWSFTSRPGGSSAALSNTKAQKPSFVVDAAGTYTVRLIVNDGTVDSSQDSVTISTVNSAPLSNAGADQTVQVNDRVQLDGSATSDVDGDALTFKWSFVSRPGGSAATLSDIKAVKPFFDIDAAGSYTVQLIVNDGSVDSAVDTVTISTQNSAPVANAGADQAVMVHDSVQLDGSGSSDVDGDSLTFNWSFNSRPNGSSATLSSTTAVKPTFDVDIAGTYTVRLIVNDSTVNSSANTVTISTDNSVPVANAGADQTVLVNDSVQLDGSSSGDVDGDSLTFKWALTSIPGGSRAALSSTTAVKPVFDVDVAGSYTVQLIVNDDTVDSAPDTVTISTGNSTPLASAGADQGVRVNDTVQLDASGSSDVDGDSLTYKWSLASKPNGSTAVLSNTQAVKPAFDIDVAGTYTLQLIVNDGTVNSAPDTVTISTENSAPVANAGANQAVLVNDTVQLNGGGSSDVDRDSLAYKWSFVARPGTSQATLSSTSARQPTFTVDLAGTYSLQLIVNDGTVNSTPDTVSISTDNSAPVSDAGADQVVRINDTVQLDGDGSSDADGDSLTFKWSVISKPGGSNAKLSSTIDIKPTFSVDAAGTYTMQLIVDDGTDYSAPDTVTIITENATPVSNAGNDQAVEEGGIVTLSGLASADPDDNIAGYTWKQTGGTSVILANSTAVETTFTAPDMQSDSETLTFQLTVRDSDGLQDVDACTITVTGISDLDSDSDGVPDNQDAFPYDPDESVDTDGDGEGNNADTDDDNDGMPDTWEQQYGLNPLKDDAADDPDGDDITNINEYNLGIKPNNFEGNLEPEAPVLLSPENSVKVSLTPLLETGDFNDPNINDDHSKTQWKITRAFDNTCVFDVTSNVALTSMTLPRQILEEDTEYILQVRFIDSHDAPSEWSEEREFITDIALNDSNGNGVPDDQEVSETLDLDEDGTADVSQSDIKCISVEDGATQMCVSIRDAENVVSIASVEAEDPNNPELLSKIKGKPTYIEFGLIDFKVLVNNPGDETTITIFLSKPAYKKGRCFKYDPVNDVWLDYSEYTQFSPNRKQVYLTIKDGGFGDADGIENGVIVDPLAFGSETDPSSGSSDSPIEEIVDGILPDLGCFISVAAGDPASDQLMSVLPLTRKQGFWLILMLPILLFLFKTLVRRTKENRNEILPDPGDSQAQLPAV